MGRNSHWHTTDLITALLVDATAVMGEVGEGEGRGGEEEKEGGREG